MTMQDRTVMSQRERDILKVIGPLLEGKLLMR